MSTGIDRINMQIMWNRLIAVVEEQAQTLIRTAFSSMVRECGDLSAGVFDLDGRMLAQAVTGTPGHVNSMAESVKHFIRRFPLETMADGDIYITNDPWMGTGHLYDISASGARFELDFPIPTGTQLEIRSMLPGSKHTTFHATGTVVRQHNPDNDPSSPDEGDSE